MGRKSINDTLIIGIDPGNVSAGISIRTVRGLEYHATVEPWHENGQLPKILPDGCESRNLRVHVVCEEPQNGTHKSRAGVNRAAGMLIAMVRGVYLVPRTRCRFVTPGVWRGTLGLDGLYRGAEDAKAVSLEAAKKLWPEAVWGSHDEAEACLVAEYGWRSWFPDAGK